MKYLLTLMGTFGFLVSVFAGPAAAQLDTPDTTCLDAALPEITSDKRVTLFKTDGTKIAGRLVSVDFEQSFLTIHELYRADRGTSTYRFVEFEKIRFRKKGHLKPGWMLVGLVGGAVIGGVIGREIDNAGSGSWCGTDTQDIATALGVVVVGGVGFLVGTIVPLILSSEMVECKLGGGGK